MLKVGPKELGYVAYVFEDPAAWRQFWQDFQKSCHVLESCLETLCERYAEQRARDPEQKKVLAFVYFRHAFFIFGALYAANGKRFPLIGADQIENVQDDESKEELMRRGQFFTDSVGDEWILNFAKFVAKTGFCTHCVGHFYALAEIFVKNAESEAGATPAETMPAELAERSGHKAPEFAREMEERVRDLPSLVREFLGRPA